MRVAVLVPYRASDTRREVLWDFTRAWWARNYPHWEITLGDAPGPVFNWGASINTAAANAGDWDVAVITDSDNVMVEPESINLAVHLARASGWVVLPFLKYAYTTPPETDVILANPDRPAAWPTADIARHCAGVYVISRATWDLLGGFTELPGWGYGDLLFYRAAQRLVGLTHLDFTCLHLFHERFLGWRDEELTARNAAASAESETVPDSELLEYLRALGANPGRSPQ